MQLRKFVSESLGRVQHDGREGAGDVLYDLYSGFLWGTVSRRYGGQHVFDRDWDVLVILDACRPDLLQEATDEYEFLTEVDTAWSIASTSREWLLKTFTPEYRDEIAETVYVTGNPFSADVLNAAAFDNLDEVWTYAWDDEVGTVPAKPLTDRAVVQWRSGGHGRMIVHYMQPHFPCVPDPSFGSAISLDRVGENWESVWDQLRKGAVSKRAVWDAYRKNLWYVLDQVDLLVRSIDAAAVIITADHANSFGSWHLYGHPPAAIPAIRQVPWVETTAADVSGYEPSRREYRSIDTETEAKLRDLGYV